MILESVINFSSQKLCCDARDHLLLATSLEFSFLIGIFMKNGNTLFANFSFYLICGEICFIEDSFLQNIFVD